jgi:hypothetical protein
MLHIIHLVALKKPRSIVHMRVGRYQTLGARAVELVEVVQLVVNTIATS